MSEVKGASYFIGVRKSLRYAFFASLVVLFGLGIYVLVNPDASPKITAAYAMEQIRNSYKELSRENSIFHQKTIVNTYNVDEGELPSVTYEVWEDMKSERIRNVVNYPNITVYQVDNREKRWDYSSDEKLLEIQTYTYEDKSLKEQKLGRMVIPTLETFDTLLGLDESVLETYEETIDGVDYFVLRSNTEEEVATTLLEKESTDYNKYYFDKENFIYRRERYYIVTDDGETLKQETIIAELESLDRTEENLENIFTFDFEIPSDTVIEETNVTVSNSGYVEEPFDVEEPIPAEDVVVTEEDLTSAEEQVLIDEINEAGFYANDEFKVNVPEGWTVISVGMEDFDYGIVIEKNGYYYEINSQVFITGGGWGYIADGLCDLSDNYEETLIKDNTLTRIDVIYPANYENEYCTRENLKIGNDENQSVWLESQIIVAGSDYPIISRSDMFNSTYDDEIDLMSISYGVNYFDNTLGKEIEYPEKDSEKLAEMIQEMDKITESVEFYQ